MGNKMKEMFKKTIKLKKNKLIVTATLLLFTSCVSVIEGDLPSGKVEKLSFSIVSTKDKKGSLSLMGSSPSCSIKWNVSGGILTHRMNCKTETEDELWAYLLGMSNRLKQENLKPIYFVRFTSKDFPKEEAYIGKIFSRSKSWKRLTLKNIKNEKNRNFSNKFLTKVIEKKGVLSLVPRALNAVGYKFKVDKVEITNYRAQRNKVLRPTGSRIVFKASRPQQIKKHL